MYNADDIPINAMWNRSDKELLEYAATRRAIVRYAAQVGFDMVRGDDERT